MLSLNNTNIIENANRAVAENERASVNDAYNLMLMDKLIADSTSGSSVAITIEELAKRSGEDPVEFAKKYKIENDKLLYLLDGMWIPIEADVPKKPNWENSEIKAVYVKNKDKLSVIPVPANFVVSKVYGENDINDGVVIYEGNEDVTSLNHENAMTTRNQFVWIPTDITGGLKAFYAGNTNEDGNDGKYYSPDPTMLANNPSLEISQIEKYNGFWVARYETGIDAISMKGKTAQVNTNYDKSKKKAEGYINNENVKSGLLTGKMWDTVCKFISTSPEFLEHPEYINKDSKSWGNYSNASYVGNDGITGSKLEFMKKNISDIAGNLWEWTYEPYGTSLSSFRCRSGFYNGNGDNSSVYRRNLDRVISGIYVGLRVGLYLM